MIVDGERVLAYTTTIDWVQPIEGADNIELVGIGGWTCIARIGEFKQGDLCVYFEIDSKLPEGKEWSKFLESKHYKVKTMKLTKFGVVSQGLALPLNVFTDVEIPQKPNQPVDKLLGVTYSVKEDNERKSVVSDVVKIESKLRNKLMSYAAVRWLYDKIPIVKRLIDAICPRKKGNSRAFPTQFEYIRKTDAERIENMTWVLQRKTPMIRTQKCDGSSATYILERVKKNKYEFYVCSRNVRMTDPTQECYLSKANGISSNPYWEMAEKYGIEDKLQSFLEINPELEYVCWQGEICGPKIQGNPHKLTTNHLFLFHMIDSEIGMYDMRKAKPIWESYEMEHVPIEEELYVLPDSLEELKKTAEGKYDPSVCDGNKSCEREGYVYYSSEDPNFYFKNVSNKYLLKHNS